MNNNYAEEVITRLRELLGVSRDIELCKELGLSPQTLSSWKLRNKVPYSVCVAQAQARGASLDWLLTGEGQMMRLGSNHNTDGLPPQPTELSARQWALLKLLVALPESDQQDVFNIAREKEKLRTLEQSYRKVCDELEALKGRG